MRRAFACMIVLIGPLTLGGCPRPEDTLEPNNTPKTATRLVMGSPAEGRVVQGNPDVFVASVGPDETLVFDIESIGTEEEDCVAFTVLSADGRTLYADQRPYCHIEGEPPIQEDGVTLTHDPGTGYELRISTGVSGEYFLTLTELGEVDNIFDYSWHYRITARTE